MGLLKCWYCGSRPKLPSAVSLQSLDSWGTSEDAEAPSKRPSTSDLSDANFSDIRREGWLYYKQILTKKGKVRRAEAWGSCPAVQLLLPGPRGPGPERTGCSLRDRG